MYIYNIIYEHHGPPPLFSHREVNCIRKVCVTEWERERDRAKRRHINSANPFDGRLTFCSRICLYMYIYIYITLCVFCYFFFSIYRPYAIFSAGNCFFFFVLCTHPFYIFIIRSSLSRRAAIWVFFLSFAKTITDGGMFAAAALQSAALWWWPTDFACSRNLSQLPAGFWVLHGAQTVMAGRHHS